MSTPFSHKLFVVLTTGLSRLRLFGVRSRVLSIVHTTHIITTISAICRFSIDVIFVFGGYVWLNALSLTLPLFPCPYVKVLVSMLFCKRKTQKINEKMYTMIMIIYFSVAHCFEAINVDGFPAVSFWYIYDDMPQKQFYNSILHV